ncbi:radical SAM protein [Thermosipho ferrireducens]|uniref:Radical SAM protein n=1 Tax=Thermosipho ferrireducens TaxID=2571116 RepID=A0ABX7S6R8_9BACT|nr:radical SAM protein [Thermosipho ferrireducens]QTA37292.1 radical SAM protein [Thermosipho ferrireducens]
MLTINPSKTLPISVTKYCALNCKHCGGVYIKRMIHISEMEKYVKRYKSFLISGGMGKEGIIPFKNYIEFLTRLKLKHDLLYNFHIGFPETPPYEIEEIADVVSFDFFSDPEILNEIYGIKRTPEHIIKVVSSLKTKKVPHITIGVLCGNITHEFNSIELLSKYFDTIVLNIFIPTKRTLYENCNPPEIEIVAQVFKEAKKKFKTVILGCMHPHGTYREKLLELIKEDLSIFVNSSEKKPDFKGCCALYKKR